MGYFDKIAGSFWDALSEASSGPIYGDMQDGQPDPLQERRDRNRFQQVEKERYDAAFYRDRVERMKNELD